MSFEKDIILKQVKKDGLIIYGARSIQKHIGFVARSTRDYDIFSHSPKQSATKLERNLDRKYGDIYFTKAAEHPVTWKVKDKGIDNKPNTKDDLEVADFTKPTRKVKTKIIDGIKYTHLSESVKDKKRAIKDPQYKFRHAKDKDDLRRIRFAKQNKIRWRK